MVLHPLCQASIEPFDESERRSVMQHLVVSTISSSSTSTIATVAPTVSARVVAFLSHEALYLAHQFVLRRAACDKIVST